MTLTWLAALFARPPSCIADLTERQFVVTVDLVSSLCASCQALLASLIQDLDVNVCGFLLAPRLLIRVLDGLTFSV